MSVLERARLQRDLTRLADGDRSAFGPVYAALQPLFSGFAAKQLSPSEADDVAQDALLKLFARVADFDPERDALSWALGIVAFEVRTARKRRARSREDSVDADGASGSPTPEDALIARDLERSARELLETLRPDEVEILERAARGQREKTAAFRKRLERAIKRLRTAWSTTHGLG